MSLCLVLWIIITTGCVRAWDTLFDNSVLFFPSEMHICIKNVLGWCSSYKAQPQVSIVLQITYPDKQRKWRRVHLLQPVYTTAFTTFEMFGVSRFLFNILKEIYLSNAVASGHTPECILHTSCPLRIEQKQPEWFHFRNKSSCIFT